MVQEALPADRPPSSADAAAIARLHDEWNQALEFQERLIRTISRDDRDGVTYPCHVSMTRTHATYPMQEHLIMTRTHDTYP